MVRATLCVACEFASQTLGLVSVMRTEAVYESG